MYKLLTDSAADLPWSYYAEHDVPFLPLFVTMDGENYPDDGTVSAKSFFDKLSAGSIATTSQITLGRFLAFFEPFLKEGYDILYTGLCAGLSNTFQSACMARDELQPLYPDRKIMVLDSTCASLGLGLLVDLLRELRDSGASLDDLVAYAEQHKLNINQRFTVEDLMFLHRGGRVSRTSAVVGSLLGIKPMLHVSPAGKLLNHGKTRGRKQSLLQLVADAVAITTSKELATVMISHGDCEEDAQFVMDEMKKIFKINKTLIHPLGATIGAHAGKGCVALFFEGKLRTE